MPLLKRLTMELRLHNSSRNVFAHMHLLRVAYLAISIHAYAAVAQVQYYSSAQSNKDGFVASGQLKISSGRPSRGLQELNSSEALINQELQVMLSVKATFLEYNPSTNSLLSSWNETHASPCQWRGVHCSSSSEQNAIQVTAIDLSNNTLNGVIPSALANLSALYSLSLSLNNLRGNIPQQLGYSSTLAWLNLSSNALSGPIPSTLGRLNDLQYLDLSSNNLTGGIPEELFLSCSQLKMLNLSDNHALGGQLPATIHNCRSLEHLFLEDDDLEGEIPAGIGQLPGLESFILANNHFSGIIPSSLFDNCGSLQLLDFSLNNLSGAVPVQIGNCSKINALILSQNLLQSIPEELGLLKKLQWLFLGKNNLSGPIPPQIGSCISLTAIDLKSNRFSGSIPDFLSTLRNLWVLALNDNQLTGKFPWQFTLIRNLHYLDLSNNLLHGSIPPAIANMSSLVSLFLAGNRFSGAIPPEIGELSSLQVLDLSSNQLSGSIPPSIGKLYNLLWLLLAHNQLTGVIPFELGNCSSLVWLNIANNILSGEIPPTLGFIGSKANETFSKNAYSIRVLPKQLGDCSIVGRWMPSTEQPFKQFAENLNRNRCQTFFSFVLRGTAPFPLCKNGLPTQSIGYIQLSANRLNGSIPSSLGQISQVGLLFLDENHLSGTIPVELSKLLLIGINFSRNSLTGSIPDALGQITCLQLLDLSYNDLSGSIPVSLQNLTWLNRFNISYNPQLSGPIPSGSQFSTFQLSSFIADTNLCYSSTVITAKNMTDGEIPVCGYSSGSGLQAPKHGSSTWRGPAEVGIILASVIGLLIVAAAGCYLRRKKETEFVMLEKEISAARNGSPHVSVFSMDLPKQLTYADLVIASNNFHENQIIGAGGFGVVYKAKLKDGSVVAIKKLIQEGPQAEREFFAEMGTLGHLHHKNLVPLMGCSTFRNEKLLVYQYMPNGSLEEWLHQRSSSAETLHWSQRLKIAIGTARGLEFLHHSCSPPIIHRDMKASNILLDENFEARLTDFGLARVLVAGDTHVSTILAGTLGYVPPEYSHTWRATPKGDVYSFGVVLLELITGGRPMDQCYHERNCGNLVEFIGMLVRSKAEQEIFDAIMAESGATNVKELQKFLNLALICTQELPSLRPEMREVLEALEAI